MDIEILWWYWVSAGLVLLVIDLILINSFFLVWLGVSAIIVGATLALPFKISMLTQVIIWGVLNVILLLGWLKLKPKMNKLKKPREMIDITGIIAEWQENKGSIRFQRPYGNSDVWDAKSTEDFAVGDTAKVTEVDIKNNVVELKR